MPGQLHRALGEPLGIGREEAAHATAAGYAALEEFSAGLRARSREVLSWCRREGRPAVMVLARPYHMDRGIGHEIEGELQARGYPILWAQHFPLDADLLDWLFGEEVREGRIRSPLDISDVWTSSYSSNTNEVLWGAKAAARCPWTTCAIHLSSYECGMDQPTFTPVQRIVEASGSLYFKFGELDSTRPAGGIRIRVETIAHYLERLSPGILERKLAALPGGCPL